MKKLIFIVVLLLPFICFGKDDFPEKSNRLVTDFTKNTLTPPQINALERKLKLFNDSSSTQIAIVIMGSTGDYDIADYGAQLGQKWGIGRKGKDNGVLILVAKDDHKMTIQIGYGLEGVAPDMLAKKIIDQEMTPAFKQNDFYGGLDKATSVLMSLARKDFPATQYMKSGGQPQERSSPIGFFAIVVFGIIFIVFFSRYRRVSHYASMNNIGFWAAWALLAASTNRSSGYYNNFNSGGGGFGGFFGGGGGDSGGGGGGFGGFGGGSFGGGGASGSW